MTKDMISTDELKFLAKKNKELEVETMMCDEVCAIAKDAIGKAVESWTQKTNNEEEKQLKVSLLNYELRNGLAYVKGQFKKEASLMMLEVTTTGGKHLLLFEEEKIAKMYEIKHQDDKAGQTSQNFMTTVLSDLKLWVHQFYYTLSEELNVEIQVEEIKNSTLNSVALFERVDLEQLCEVKVYQVESDELAVYHLSDTEFIEYAYENVKEKDVEEVAVIEKVEEVVETKLTEETDLEMTQVPTVKKPMFMPLDEVQEMQAANNLGILHDVPLEISVVLGKTKRSIREILDVNIGKIIELDKFADDPLEIYCNGKLIAEGEVVIVDETFGVKVTKLHQNGLQTIR